MQEAPHLFGAWESFYVIVGSSAAALTGLQFVMITLAKEAWREPSTGEIDAFATPTIVHFCAVLLVSATLSAPWPGLLGPQLIMAAAGLTGIAYAAFITWRATHRTRYKMVLEDWIWHVALPIVAYLVMVVGAFTLDGQFIGALFAIAGSALLLLYIGIHNAWDATTYVASGRAAAEASKRDEQVSSAAARTREPSPEPVAVSSSADRL
jgi:hypothetical protein